MKKVYIHISNSRDIQQLKVGENPKVGELIKMYTPQIASEPDYEEDAEVYIEDRDDDLSKDILVDKVSSDNIIHLHISRCRKVQLTVSYAGREFADKFSPATTLKKVFEKAIHHFNIHKDEGSKLLFFLDVQSNDSIDFSTHVGSITDYPVCSATLYLSEKIKYQG